MIEKMFQQKTPTQKSTNKKNGDPERNRTSNWGLGIPRYIRLTTGPQRQYSPIRLFTKEAIMSPITAPLYKILTSNIIRPSSLNGSDHKAV